jgi:hypothetical protein
MFIPEYTPGLIKAPQHERDVLDVGNGSTPAKGSTNPFGRGVGVGEHVEQVAPPTEPYL